MRRAILIGIVAGLVLPSAALASADDGFSGYEKQITHVTGGGEPEIAVGPDGTPLLVSFNGCGVAASHDGGATFGPLHAIDSNLYPQVQGEQAGDYIPAAAHHVVAFAYAASAAPGRTDCPCGIFETSRHDGASWTRHRTPFPANWVA